MQRLALKVLQWVNKSKKMIVTQGNERMWLAYYTLIEHHGIYPNRDMHHRVTYEVLYVNVMGNVTYDSTVSASSSIR